MKCNMIRDLLPMYIDGLTSKESNREIEKHLKNCKECQEYYQEMSGKIIDTISITDEEARDVELLKKMKQRNRKKRIGLAAGIIVIVCVSVFLVLAQIRCTAMYDEVTLNYGVRRNKVWFTMETKPGYEMHITGSTGGKDSTVRVLGVSEGSGKADKMGWESELGTENDPCRCTIIFADRTLVFENGKLVKDTEN